MKLFWAYFLSLAIAQPVFFVAITRHGSRSPEKFAPWDNNERWPEGPGMLTAEGLRQEYLLGVNLKQRYQNNFGLISSDYIPGQIEIYSSYYNRTQLSAKGISYGLFQGSSIQEPRGVTLPFPSIITSKYKDKITSSVALPIMMNKYTINGMLVPQTICEEYVEYIKKKLSTVEMNRIYMRYDDLILTIANYLKVNRKQARLRFDEFYDSVYCNNFMGFEIPGQFTWNWLKRAMKLHVEKYMYLKHEPDYFAKFPGNLLLSKISELLQDRVNGKYIAKKGVIYSAHDSTIQNLLVALGLFDWKHPPLASLMQIELLVNGEGKYQVRIIYNDKELFLTDKKTTVDFSEFQEFVKTRTFVDNSDACAKIAHFVDIKKVEESETGYVKLLVLNSFIMITVLLAINYLIKK